MEESVDPQQPRGALWRLLAVVLGLIVYGSLYPFSFSTSHHSILAWAWDPGLAGLRDGVVNLTIYFPVGFLLCFTSSAARGRGLRIVQATLGGLLLSGTLESLQAFDQGRVSSGIDLLLNTLGAAAGASTASLLLVRHPLTLLIQKSPAAFAILVLAFLSHTFPFFPRLHPYWSAFQTTQVLLTTADWLTVRCALTVLLQRSAVTPELALLELVIPARLFILDQAMALHEVAGGLLALAIGHIAFNRSALRPRQLCLVMLANVVAIELLPFNFQAAAAPFHSIPFETLLQGPSIGAVIFLNKLLLYGSLLWVWDPEARHMWRYGLAAAGLVATLEWMQRYLPGRTADITDAVIVLLAACTLATLRRPRALTADSGGAPSSARSLTW